MRIDDRGTDRKTKPETMLLGGEEWFESAASRLVLEPDATIHDLDLRQARRRLANADRHDPKRQRGRVHGIHGIHDEVQQELLKLHRVSVDQERTAGQL